MGTGYFEHHRIVSAVKRVDFVSDTMSYMDLRYRWRSIIVLNVHVPSEKKSDDSKGSFYGKLELVFCYLPKNQTKIPLGDVNGK